MEDFPQVGSGFRTLQQAAVDQSLPDVTFLLPSGTAAGQTVKCLSEDGNVSFEVTVPEGTVCEQPLSVSVPRTALTPTKRALVIGINDYPIPYKLKCSVADAIAVAEALRRMKFEVTLITDCDTRQLQEARRSFRESLRKGDIVLFYFAGHGVEVARPSIEIPDKWYQFNWLLTKDLPADDGGLEQEAIKMQEIFAEIAICQPRFNCIILDCCRDNPLPAKTRSAGASSFASEMKPPDGSFLMFACSPGQKSLEKRGHGVFTKNLLLHIEKEDQRLDDLAIAVCTGVASDTEHLDTGKQRPYWHAAMVTTGCLAA